MTTTGWTSIRGHRDQIAMFRRAVERGRLAHAYLFVGPPGVGKRLVARTIAQSLFCRAYRPEDLAACGECPDCKQVASGTHPDLMLVGLPPGKRELPVAAFLGDGDKRGREGLLHDLALKPMTAPRRVAIIDDADCMNEASANALLKTLEEPPPGAILFLISPSQDVLLPTIRSRCQPLLFSALSETDVAELLVEHDLAPDAESARQVARLSEGSLDVARQLLDPELRQLQLDVRAALAAANIDPFATSAALLKRIDDIEGGSAAQREAAGWVLRFCIDELRESLRQPGDVASSPGRVAPEVWADRQALMIERCLVAESHLAQSMPLPLCLEALWLDLTRIRRGDLVLVG
jgi:DNA polymerase-3 subunit delta'